MNQPCAPCMRRQRLRTRNPDLTRFIPDIPLSGSSNPVTSAGFAGLLAVALTTAFVWMAIKKD